MKEIKDLNGTPVKAGDIFRLYSDYCLVVEYEGKLYGFKVDFTHPLGVNLLDGHIEVIDIKEILK